MDDLTLQGMISNVKLMLGSRSSNYSDDQIELFVKCAASEAESYCNRDVTDGLEDVVQQMTIVKLNRMNAEGISSQNYSGVSESYVDGYPKEIMMVLNRKRKMKVLW